MPKKDIISKQIFKRIFIDVTTYLFKLDLQEVELIEMEQQRIEDRRADLVAKVVDSAGKTFIVHLEIQNRNRAEMPDRMLRYLTDIRLSYPNQTVYQYLLYIGKSRLSMADGITTEQLHYRYPVLDMHEMDYQFFMQQNTADALVLAVLCDFKDTEPRAVVHEILQRLIAMQRDDPQRLREYVTMLEVLADNRNLKLDIAEEFKMLEVNVERLPSYLIGEERGFERGLKLGAEQVAEQWIKQGVEQGVELVAKRLFELNFSVAEITEITGLTVEKLQQLSKK